MHLRMLLQVEGLRGIYCVSCCSRKGGLSCVSAWASLLTLCRERDSSTRNKFLAQNDNRGWLCVPAGAIATLCLVIVNGVGRYVGYCTPNPVILSGAKRSRRISSWLLRVDCLHGAYCVSCCSRKGGLSCVSAWASLLTLCRERDSSIRNEFLAQNDNRGWSRAPAGAIATLCLVIVSGVGRYVGYCTPNPVILSGAKRSRRISS